jgi:hypothetical protein
MIIEMCAFCGFEQVEGKSYDGRYGSKRYLCLLCASTPAGNAHDYPENYPGHATMAVVCYVGNTILKAIEANGPPRNS